MSRYWEGDLFKHNGFIEVVGYKYLIGWTTSSSAYRRMPLLQTKRTTSSSGYRWMPLLRRRRIPLVIRLAVGCHSSEGREPPLHPPIFGCHSSKGREPPRHPTIVGCHSSEGGEFPSLEGQGQTVLIINI